MAEVWLGEQPFAVALGSGAIRLEGPPKLVHAFPGWLQLSKFAATPRPQADRGT